jgi:HAD superfamily hydrolase (TIGR01509 family)
MIPRHIIFDCDGVLVDSEPLSMEVDWELLREHGVELSREDVIRRFVGLTFGAMVEQVKAEFGIELPDDLSAIKDKRLLDVYEDRLAAVEGALQAVDAIQLPRSVASNSPRARVEAAFRISGFSDRFGKRITTFEDVRSGKPAPDIYIKAAERATAAPSACVVVEDSVAGVTSAVAAGCVVLGFTGTSLDPARHGNLLSQAGAYQTFSYMAQLPGLVSGLLNP